MNCYGVRYEDGEWQVLEYILDTSVLGTVDKFCRLTKVLGSYPEMADAEAEAERLRRSVQRSEPVKMRANPRPGSKHIGYL